MRWYFMDKLQIFQSKEFGKVRTVLIENEVWFVLIDICKILELSNPSSVIKRLDEDEVTKFDLGSLSGITNIINESGLYKVIFRSDKPQANQFTKWVTHDVLPSLRKTGIYSINQTPKELELKKKKSNLKLLNFLIIWLTVS